MALSETPGRVTATSTGASDHISLVPGREYVLSFTSAGAFVVDLQRLAGDGASLDDVFDETGKITIDSSSGKQNVIVPAGKYSMNVTTYNSPITMWAEEA